MPIRSMKMKLKIYSGRSAPQLRQGLWRLHRLLNEGTAYYMDWLVHMRQEALPGKSKEEIIAELERRVRQQQEKNGVQNEQIPMEEVLSALRQLYEIIVPSAVNKSGNAQILSRTFLSPLVDPDSKGAKRDSDTKEILDKLETFGLKPLFPLYTNIVKDIRWMPFRNRRQFVRYWDRDMFQQAIEHLLSWESWNHKVNEERAKLKETVKRFEEQHFTNGIDWLRPLQEYEANREQALRDMALSPSDRFRITRRQIKGWDELYERWNKLGPTASVEDYMQEVRHVQKKLGGEFGDADLYRFLAKPENVHIWRDSPARLHYYAAYNHLHKQLMFAKEQAAFTLPDPVAHPLWVRFEARDGNNLFNYTLQADSSKQRSRRYVNFERFLWPGEDGLFEETENVKVELALSKQFYRQVIIHDNPTGKQQITFQDYSSKEMLEGHLGGAKIQLDRKFLRKAGRDFETGDFGPAFLNVVLDLKPKQEVKNGRLQSPLGQALHVISRTNDIPKVYGYNPEALAAWLEQASGAASVGSESLMQGFRVMSVDLGLRSAAAISVFSVKGEKTSEGDKICYPVGETGLFAVHDRSFLLRLPGESSEKRVKMERDKRKTERRKIKYHIRTLARVLRLANKATPMDRIKAVQDVLNDIESTRFMNDRDRCLYHQALETLRLYAPDHQEIWEEQVIAAHRKLEHHVGIMVGEWRKNWGKGRRGTVGLSMDNIEELDESRRLLISWSRRARYPREAKRFQENESSPVHLLRHLQNLKEDRLKQLANLIVMTALGYVYDSKEKTWKAAHPACQLILFEDLERYRFRLDRSARENSQLMKWAHRSIPKYVWMQGEPYGLQIGDVWAAFSSRYHAKTGAPGIRCKALTEKDFQQGRLLESLVAEGLFTHQEVGMLKPGDIVPAEGGELFVTVADASRDRLVITHADINAAQNLQKRFWLANSERFRVACQSVRIDSQECFVPSSKSVAKKMGKGVFVRDFSFDKDMEVYHWNNQVKLTAKNKNVPTDHSDDLQDLQEYQAILEEARESSSSYKTLYRDPSGFFFPDDVWVPQHIYWREVKKTITALLRKRIMST